MKYHKTNWLINNIHLIISIAIVVPTGIIYGSPAVLPDHLNIEVLTVDLANMLKAIMFLYLGISAVWVMGIWKTRYWKIATQLNALFMLTLATGRLYSMIMDGIPTNGYIFGVTAELILGVFALIQLNRHKI